MKKIMEKDELHNEKINRLKMKIIDLKAGKKDKAKELVVQE